MSELKPSIHPRVHPSFFTTLRDQSSKPLESLEELRRLIVSDFRVAIVTETYRKRLGVSLALAKEYKPEMPAFSVSVQMDGNGKTLEHVVGETLLLMLDYDHLEEASALERAFSAACKVPLTLVCYRTISGKGLRVLVRYARPAGCQFSIEALHQEMVAKARTLYDALLGIESDSACCDLVRLCGLAHDPQAYFHWEAQALQFTEAEANALFKRLQKKRGRPKGRLSASTKKAKAAEAAAMKRSSSSSVPTMEEAAPHVCTLLDQWGFSFESGRHNEYVCRFAQLCVNYGIPESDVQNYAGANFASDYPDAAAVIRSCYKHTERFRSWHFYRPGETMASLKASVRVVKQWISMRYELHYNCVTGRHEVRSLDVREGKYPQWKNLDDVIENSLWAELDEAGLHLPVQKLHSIINSDFSEAWNPLEEYLRALPPWDGEHDYIAELADRVSVEELPDYHHDQQAFRDYFRKWLVAMVVGWVTPKVVNQTICILVGRGGIYKTTFFNYLLPPELRMYYMNDSTANYVDKDFMEAFSSKALICLDEFDATFGKSLNAFKSNMTKLEFSIRRPYDRYRSDLPHRATLAGTSNVQHIISDVENRRYSPWIVKSIESPLDHPLDYRGIYSQAVALGQLVRERQQRREAGWVYWPTHTDIEEMRQHNRLFMTENYAEEQIKRLYRVPEENSNKLLIKFRYNAEILERIAANPAIRQNLSSQGVGSVMARLGFPKAHRKHGNGWWVIEKEGLELNNDSSFVIGEDEL